MLIASNGRKYYYSRNEAGKKRRISRKDYENNNKKETIKLYFVNGDDLTEAEKYPFQEFLYKNCFSNEFSSARQLLLPGKVYWLEKGGHKMVSMLCFEEATRMIYNVCTAQDEQRKGYARQLVQAILDQERDRKREVHRHEVRLHVWPENQAAISLYQSLGFRIIGEASAANDGRIFYIMARRFPLRVSRAKAA